MNEATKTTENKLQKAAENGNGIAQALYFAVDAAKYADENSPIKYIAAGLKFSTCIDEWMNTMRGLEIQFPKLVKVFNTHDLQYATISDINKLARLITK